MRIMKSVLAILLLVCMLTSCNLSFVSDLVSQIIPEHSTPESTTESTPESNTTPEEPTEEDLYPEPIKQLLAENKPYSLEFVSNGDGTCYVSRLYLNNQYETEFDIIIPEKSPAGDVVTGIHLGDSITAPSSVVPKFMTWEQLMKIQEQVETEYPKEESGKVGLWWINAYFEYDVAKMEPGMREEMLKRYPVLEYVTLALWSYKMSNMADTFRRVDMAGITPHVTKQYYQEFIQDARDKGASEEVLSPYKEQMDALPAYANWSVNVRYLHIPSSVKNIDAEALHDLMLVSTLNGNKPQKGVVLPAFDLETVTAIVQNLGIYFGHDLRGNFIIFSQSPTAEGYEEFSNFAVYSPEEPQDDILAWRYVDGVPTLWE